MPPFACWTEDQGLVLGCVGGGKLKHSGKLKEKLCPLLNSRTKKAAAQKKVPSSKEPVQKEPNAKKKKTPQRKPKPKKERNSIQAIVDTDDIHCLMIGASGVGKTAFFLYPNLEYACASGMSFFASDTKGDLARNYGAIARDCYGYQVAVVDLRNPTRSDGYNLLTLINHYMDACRRDPADLAARAKAEKYAKILSKTVINPDEENFAQNQYFYDAAEGVLTAVILLLAEYLPPREIDGVLRERRHIVSVFKLVQELLAPSILPDKNEFQLLMDRLPEEHKAKLAIV